LRACSFCFLFGILGAAFGGLSIKAVDDGVGNLVAKSRLSLERDHNLLLYRMLDTTREYFGHADM
jgi:hypothetical protein